MNSTQRGGAIALVLAVGLAGGFLCYRWQYAYRRAAIPRASTLQPPRASAAMPEQDEEAIPPPLPPVPSIVPALELPDLAGKAHSLRSFVGRPLIINFWATWCEPCRREIPLLQQLLHSHRSQKLQIVGIAVDFRQAVQDFMRRERIEYPVLIGEEDGFAAVQRFGMEPVLPFSVFADAQGDILAVKIGELHRDEADFVLAQLQAVDEGRIELPQAREQVQSRLRELAMQRAALPARSTHDPVSSTKN
jgi:thiol-disulfide isomerase/thioredoxin